jgi:hypothetical protein
VAASLLLAGHLPFWLQVGFDALLRTLVGSGFGWAGALSFGNGMLLVGAVFLTRGIAMAVAPAVRQAADRSPTEGRAAAAGACMTAAALSGVAIAVAHGLDLFFLGRTGLWLLGLRLGASALAVGLFGAHLFHLVDKKTRIGPAPPLYTFLSGAGIATAVGLLGLGLLGAAPSGLGAMAFLGVSSLLSGCLALGLRPRGPAELPEGSG